MLIAGIQLGFKIGVVFLTALFTIGAISKGLTVLIQWLSDLIDNKEE